MSCGECPILGQARDLSDHLPTIGDVLRCYNYILVEKKKETIKHPSVSSICEILVSKILFLWRKLQPSTELVSERQIMRLLTASHTEHVSLQRKLRRCKGQPAVCDKPLSDFKAKCDLIFNIAACKCLKVKCVCKPFHKRFETNTACPGPSAGNKELVNIA